MGDTTPVYDLPYPVGSDRVRDGDNAIQALAEQVEAVLFGALVPTGAVMPFAGNVTPTGWLLAQGQNVSRTTYATLFGVIGTAYGAGDGSTTFGLPDLRSRIALGAGSGTALRDRTRAAAGGGEDAVLPFHGHGGGTGGESSDHSHSGSADTGGQSVNHTHGVSMRSVATNTGGAYDSYGLNGGSPVTAQTGNPSAAHAHHVDFATGGRSAGHIHGVSAEGGSAADARMPPYVVLNYIIRT